MMGATRIVAKELVAVDRIWLNRRLSSELQQETQDYHLLIIINSVLQQELEPFDFHHKLVLKDQLAMLGLTEDVHSQTILNIIPDFIQDVIENELIMLKNMLRSKMTHD